MNTLETLYGWCGGLFGLSLKAEQLGFGQMTARALIMYIVLLAIIRAGKKRFLGSATAFDVVLVIILGSIASRAITGNAPFFVSMVALAALVAMHWIISAVSRDWKSFSDVVKGHSTILIRDGRVDRKALKAAHMSQDDLDEDLRSQGIDDVKEAAEARLERSGKLSVIRKDGR